MFFRTMLRMVISRRSSSLNINDVAQTKFRVLPTDLDVLNHMNNGVYFSIMDLGRMDLLIRAGAWTKLRKLGYFPVVVSETISFRRSLQPWQRFVVESRIAGYDDKAVFLEQRFVVNGEIYAKGFIRGRFLKKSGGTVDTAELATALDVDIEQVKLPDWLSQWSLDVALPPSRATARSEWSDLPSS